MRTRWAGAGTQALLVLVILLRTASRAVATAQAPDVIVVDGKHYSLTVNPLEAYLSEHPGKRPGLQGSSTANWRGYVAHFAVREDSLFLTDVRSDGGKTSSLMRDVFTDGAPVLVDWFTGHLIIPDGKEVRYVHMGYGSEYECYIVMRIAKGVVSKTTRMSHEAFGELRLEQFQAFKSTAAYRKALAEIQKSGDARGPKMAEEFLYEYLSSEYMSQVFE